MTGFARMESRHPWGTFVWELRSVNHRYLEPHFRLPEVLRALEPSLREHIRNNLQRGKLEAALHFQHNEECQVNLGINLELAQKIVGAAQKINDLISNPAPTNALEILQWPGVIQGQELDPELMQNTSLQLFKDTLKQLIENRQREGQELKTFIEQRLAGITEQISIVREKLPSILQTQREKILSRLQAIKVELDNDRLEQEMVYLSQKADVDEELDRLDTHITEVARTLKQKGAIGRRLDFLMQELNREANTLSSKSIVSETTQVAVNLKVLIEQMREQIQNIE
jgi:uncharacterized protein (TIGR00255 family)